jgi:hypothetical protein
MGRTDPRKVPLLLPDSTTLVPTASVRGKALLS